MRLYTNRKLKQILDFSLAQICKMVTSDVQNDCWKGESQGPRKDVVVVVLMLYGAVHHQMRTVAVLHSHSGEIAVG